MEIIIPEDIQSWIGSYGTDASEIWQRHLDAGILVVETMPFHVLVRWGRPIQNDENAEVIKTLVEDGLVTDDLFPKTKDGNAICWSDV
jgi:hypothetical protein